jgi:hypothetical protein
LRLCTPSTPPFASSYDKELARIERLRAEWNVPASSGTSALTEAQGWKVLAYVAAAGDAAAYFVLLDKPLSEVFELYCIQWHLRSQSR